MRKLIAAMKISADEKVNTDDGDADWVQAWSDDDGMMSQVDRCVTERRECGAQRPC
jgi:hypothetical protein